MRTRRIAAFLFLCVVTSCAEDPTTSVTEERTATSSAPTSGPTDEPTDGPTDQSSAEPSPPDTRPSERGTKVLAAASDFGTILFDHTGQAIYLFDVETSSRPRCYGPCAEAWPPVVTEGAPLAGAGVEQSLLGTTRRADGTSQVTYGGHPLYFYAHEGRNEVKCHDVFLNGGTWYAVQPDGRRAP